MLLRHLIALALLFVPASLTSSPAVAQTSIASSGAQQPVGLIAPALTEKLLPSSVLYKGQLAPVQGRNSGAIRHPDGSLTIASMVDSSGYSSSVREKFQFFLYTEHALSFSGKTLTPGFYGAGFVASNTLVIMSVDGHEVLTAPTTADAGVKRPRPLQIVASPEDAAIFRLYLGRSFVTLTPAK